MAIKGHLGPEATALRYYQGAVLVDLTYEKILEDPFPTPQEAKVWFKLGAETQTACVPLFLVDKVSRTAKAELLGESDGKILVSFPPTNFGQTRFYAFEEDLEAIARGSSNGTK